MKRFVLCCASFALILSAVSLDQDAFASTAVQSKTSAAQAAAIATKLELLGKYFGSADIASVVSMWTPDGTYADDSGKLYSGRDALKKLFESAAANDTKAEITLKPDSTKALAPNVMLSEGTVVRKLKSGETVPDSRYSLIFTKQGNDWLISSATETPIVTEEVEAKPDSVNDLSWMVGDWKANGNGSSLKLHIDWANNKNFLRWNYEIQKPGETAQENTELIGFDPKSGKLVSWSFDSAGGIGQSSWTKNEKSWQTDQVKYLSDGSNLSARNIITPKGDGFTWQSVDRNAGGIPLPDTAELQIERETK
jgi:ketosteroid isomerase-like protein